jgi:hypothetical protein
MYAFFSITKYFRIFFCKIIFFTDGGNQSTNGLFTDFWHENKTTGFGTLKTNGSINHTEDTAEFRKHPYHNGRTSVWD